MTIKPTGDFRLILNGVPQESQFEKEARQELELQPQIKIGIEPDPFDILAPAHKPIGPDPAGPNHGHLPPRIVGPCEVSTTNPNYCPQCLCDHGTGHHTCNC